jgi:four helix bundle protein
MSKINRFEDIEAWQKARNVVKSIYEITKTGLFSKDHCLKNQILRAAVSIPSNIAEGFSRHSNKEFVQFLFIAKSSAAEVQTQLYLAMDQKYITHNQFDDIYKELEITSKQISKFITYLKAAG